MEKHSLLAESTPHFDQSRLKVKDPTVPSPRSWNSSVLESPLQVGRSAWSTAKNALMLRMLRRVEHRWTKPKHAAFILDGNRRFALKAKLPTCRMGHERGAARFLELIAHCHRYGINNLSVYAFSIENFSRSEREIAAILDIVRSTCDSMLDPTSIVNRMGCRLRVVGDRSLVPEDVRLSIARAEEHTRNHTVMTVFMSVAYDGREEIVRAARRCVADERRVCLGITMADMAREMYVRAHGIDVPPVDLVVRTGGARRLSSFLMWDSSHAEIYFDDTLWPDFGEYHFLRALAAFNQRIESSQASDLHYWGDGTGSPAFA